MFYSTPENVSAVKFIVKCIVTQLNTNIEEYKQTIYDTIEFPEKKT